MSAGANKLRPAATASRPAGRRAISRPAPTRPQPAPSHSAAAHGAPWSGSNQRARLPASSASAPSAAPTGTGQPARTADGGAAFTGAYSQRPDPVVVVQRTRSLRRWRQVASLALVLAVAYAPPAAAVSKPQFIAALEQLCSDHARAADRLGAFQTPRDYAQRGSRL